MCIKAPYKVRGRDWEAAFCTRRWHLQSVGRLCKDEQQAGILLEKAKGKGGSLCRKQGGVCKGRGSPYRKEGLHMQGMQSASFRWEAAYRRSP